MNSYDDPYLSAARQILDAIDEQIDNAISRHNADLEDSLYDCKRAVFRLQAKRLQQLQEQGEAAE